CVAVGGVVAGIVVVSGGRRVGGVGPGPSSAHPAIPRSPCAVTGSGGGRSAWHGGIVRGRWSTGRSGAARDAAGPSGGRGCARPGGRRGGPRGPRTAGPRAQR